MKRSVIVLSVSILSLTHSTTLLASHISGSGISDFGNRITGASDIAVDNQLAVMPLPMNKFLKGRYEVGFSGGYSTVEAGPLDFKGPLFSASFSYSPMDKYGFYVFAFTKKLDASGGGQDKLVTPFLSSVPLDLPANTEFSNVMGSINQTGLGFSLVFDPLAHKTGPREPSMPMFIGVVYDNLKHDGVKADYRILDGTDAGATGQILYNDSYSFFMPVAGLQFPVRFGPIRLIPNVMGFFPLDDKAQKATLTGAFGTLSGDSESAGHSDANLGRPLGSFGLTVEFVPWGLSANIGATIFKLISSSIIDEIDSVALFNLTKSFGNANRSD
jgi:hypothetical protein